MQGDEPNSYCFREYAGSAQSQHASAASKLKQDDGCGDDDGGSPRAGSSPIRCPAALQRPRRRRPT
eukprot:5092071-Pyramimonas_sp.AAC.1